jgi:hypothetical protein
MNRVPSTALRLTTRLSPVSRESVSNCSDPPIAEDCTVCPAPISRTSQFIVVFVTENDLVDYACSPQGCPNQVKSANGATRSPSPADSPSNSFRRACVIWLEAHEFLCFLRGHRHTRKFEHHRQIEGRTVALPLDMHVIDFGHLVTIRAQ